MFGWCTAQGILVQINMATKRGVIIALPEAGTWLLVKLRHLLFPSYLKKVDQKLALSLTVNWHWQPLLWNFFAWLGKVSSWMHNRDNKQGLREAFWKYLETKSLTNWLCETEMSRQLWYEWPCFLVQMFMVPKWYILMTWFTFHLTP